MAKQNMQRLERSGRWIMQANLVKTFERMSTIRRLDKSKSQITAIVSNNNHAIDDCHVSAICPHLGRTFAIPPPGDQILPGGELHRQNHTVHKGEGPLATLSAREGCRKFV